MNEFKFTTEQINQILNYLGEIPSKYSMTVIQFIQTICNKQLNKVDEVGEEL